MAGAGFTVEERITLHLSDLIRYRHEVEVLPSMTQQGIADVVNIARKHAPRSLNSMIDKGLIMERKTHVRGKSQRMKTYHLSVAGQRMMDVLMTRAEETVVSIISEDENIVDMDLQVAKKELSRSYAHILSRIDDEGIYHDQKIDESPGTMGQDKMEIYRSALEQAWEDGRITRDEREMLSRLMDTLGITEKEHFRLEQEVLSAKNDPTSHDDNGMREAYKILLEQAMADGKITNDERAMLDKIKERIEEG